MAIELEKNSKYKILTGYDDWSNIVLVLKEEQRTFVKTFTGIEWYFVILTKDFKRVGGEEKFRELFNKTEDIVQKTNRHGKFTRIYCKYTTRSPIVSSIVAKLKNANVTVYESDLTRTKRFLVDKKIPIADDLNILYFDIETDDSSGNGIEIGRDQILSWAAYNNKGNSWFVVDDDERKLIKELLKVIDSHDVFVGWNSQKFDFPYILKRMEILKLEYDWRRRIHLDLMKRCIKLYTYEMDKIGLTGFSLNEVSRVFLKEQKVKHTESIKEMFDNNRKLLEKYNRKDAELLMKLDAKLEITKLMINECVWTGTTLNRFYVGELLDNYMLRKSKDINQYLYSRPTKEEAEANKALHIIGGYVKPPITGLYSDVRIFDFKCFVPGTKVYTGRGYLNIEDVTITDKVQDMHGKFVKLATCTRHKFSGNLKKITASCEHFATCTPNHKWPVISNKQFLLKEAKDLERGDYLLSPKQLMIHENIGFSDAIKCKKLKNAISIQSQHTNRKSFLDTYEKRRILKIEDIAYSGIVHSIGLLNQCEPYYIANDLLTKNSLYPSMIVSWNIGPDSMDLEKTKLGDIAFNNFVGPDRKIEDVEFTEWRAFLKLQKRKVDPKNECYQTANNNFFKKDIDSFISSLCKELLELRVEMKKKLSGLKPGSPEYGSTRSAQAIVKELANCLHPDTLLYVHDMTTDVFVTKSIKEIHNSTHSFQIQSYDFNTKQVCWKNIKHVWSKKYNGNLKQIEYHHSLPITCTPEHRLFTAEFKELSYSKTNSGNTTPTYHKDIDKPLPSTDEVKLLPASKLTKTHLSLATAATKYTENEMQYLDLRKYDYMSVIYAKAPALLLSCAKKRYRNRPTVFTANSEFNNLVEERYVNRHKKSKQLNGRYSRFVRLDSELWAALQKLSIDEVLEYEMKIRLSSNGHTVPLIWNITSDLLWAFGIYIAEGCGGISVDKGSVIGGLKMSNTREEYTIRFENALREVGFKPARVKRNKIGCALLCAFVGEFFNYEFHTTSNKTFNATTKSVPSWIFSLPKLKILSFLEGYADGDGNSKNRDKLIRCTTVSPHLLHQISDLLRYIYNKPIDQVTAPPANINSNTSYRLIIRLQSKSQRIFRRIQNEHSFDTVKNITDIEYIGKVYDIEVENTHNFFIGNILSKNSLYGITGDRSSRYFDKNIAESITITGQFLTKAASYVIEDISTQKVIYCDTDSIFIPISGTNIEIDELCEKVNTRLKRSLNGMFSLTTNIVYLDYEKAYKKMIMVDKKRYTGTMAWLNSQKTDMLFSKGLEDVKKNTIGITKRAMRKLSEMITSKDKDSKYVRKWVETLKEKIFNEKFKISEKDLVISTRLSKPTYKYASKTAHVILAEQMIKDGKILQPSEDADAWGTRISYVISTSTPKQIAVHIDDFDGTWDRRYYWETQIYAPIMRVLQIVWPTEDWECYSLEAQERRARLLEREEKKKQQIEFLKQREIRKKERLLARAQREKELLERKAEREKAKKAREKIRLEREIEKEKKKKARLLREKEREHITLAHEEKKKSKQLKLDLN